MADLLIRDVPDAVVTGLDAAAARAGVSRVEYVRRTLAAEIERAAREARPVTRDDWRHFGGVTADLADEEAMREAWS